MRFIALVFGLALLLAMIYFSILFWGLGRQLPRFDNAFLKTPRPVVLLSWDSALLENQNPDLQPRRVIWFPIYRDADGSLKVLPSAKIPPAQEELPPHFTSDGPRLLEALRPWAEKQPQPGFVFQILSNVDEIQTQFADELKDFKLERVLVQSEYDNVMKAIKSIHPMWAYGTSASDRVRWMIFASLGLAPAVTSKNDIYVTPLRIRNIPALSEGIIAELRRRNDLVWIGPLRTGPEVEEAKADGATGFWVTTPEAFDALPQF